MSTKISKLQVPKLPAALRLADYLMVPIMFLLGGLKRDSIQETHAWHCWSHFDLDSIDQSKVTRHKGTDTRTFSRHFLFLFHAPIFGGWKEYVVISTESGQDAFYVGWVMYEGGVLKEKAVNRLLIKGGSVRLLSGPPNYEGFFFAVNEAGEQIKINKSGSGRLGDHSYPGTRLL